MQKSNVDFYPVLLLSILADTLLRLPCAGTRSVKRLPRPGAESTVIVPPSARAQSRTLERP